MNRATSDSINMIAHVATRASAVIANKAMIRRKKTLAQYCVHGELWKAVIMGARRALSRP